METTEKIYTLELRDKFNLQSEVLYQYAIDSVNEMARDYGWEVSEVKPSSAKPKKDNEFLIHSFDVYGKDNHNAEPGESSTDTKSTSGYSKSASEAGL